MCKHVAAVLYGVGARLDEKPALLFALRGVDENQLLANAGQELSLKKPVPATTKVLDSDDVAALFGLELEMGETLDPALLPVQNILNSIKREILKTHAGKRAVASKKGNRKGANRQEPPALTVVNQRKRSKQPRTT